ncbi:MAG: hypothetical protein ABL999_14780 [Pyrinomonadaceae bacterium]
MNNEKKEKEPKEPLRIPLDFEETLGDLLKVKPPPDKKPNGGKREDKKSSK